MVNKNPYISPLSYLWRISDKCRPVKSIEQCVIYVILKYPYHSILCHFIFIDLNAMIAFIILLWDK